VSLSVRRRRRIGRAAACRGVCRSDSRSSVSGRCRATSRLLRGAPRGPGFGWLDVSNERPARRTAKPWTADQATISASRRRFAGMAPDATSSSRAAARIPQGFGLSVIPAGVSTGRNATARRFGASAANCNGPCGRRRRSEPASSARHRHWRNRHSQSLFIRATSGPGAIRRGRDFPVSAQEIEGRRLPALVR
jgi:hypothetical protein